MLTKELNKNPIKIILITDDNYLTTAIKYHFFNINHYKSNEIINYITNKEIDNKIVLVDDRCEGLKLLNHRNISRENDFLMVLRSSNKGERDVPFHNETFIELSVSTICFCNRFKKFMYIYTKNKCSSFPRKNILTDAESIIIKLLCMNKTPKEIAKIKNYRYPALIGTLRKSSINMIIKNSISFTMNFLKTKA
ncbi:hypothetical protein ACO03_20890 (plasmid) [Pantoea ananatis]|nr:hypothetical protein ACO03_20890 [Pantoea ananatis]